ncbi:MAG: AmmeMemoRadiSam system radical SAM enzyme [Myxococcales bacterium]|jgi:pyruvate formate lyase activating enzyme
MKLDRRELLETVSLAALGACAACAFPRLAHAGKSRAQALHEARHYTSLAGGDVQCHLCPCSPYMKVPGRLGEGQTCVCRVRTNRGGTLYVTNYGRAAVLRREPLEKNPLFHYHPGQPALAVAAPGCSLECKGCQNWQLALAATDEVETIAAPPTSVVKLARREGCRFVTATYSEPMMYFEYLEDIARAAAEEGIATTAVTGGYVNPKPVRELCRHVEAFSVSAKALTDEDYRDYARGSLRAVQRTMETVKQAGRWLEIVVLVVPTVSDDPKKLRDFVRWAKRNLGADTPIHFDRFWPSHHLRNLPQTPQKVLEDTREIARAEGLRYAYIGNLPGHTGANTLCPACGKVLIRRVAFKVLANALVDGRCACGQAITGVWS